MLLPITNILKSRLMKKIISILLLITITTVVFGAKPITIITLFQVVHNTNMNNKTNFIFEHWEIINFSVLGLTIFTIALVLFSKESIKLKVINIIIILFLPVIGSLYYFGRILFHKRKKVESAS